MVGSGAANPQVRVSSSCGQAEEAASVGLEPVAVLEMSCHMSASSRRRYGVVSTGGDGRDLGGRAPNWAATCLAHHWNASGLSGPMPSTRPSRCAVVGLTGRRSVRSCSVACSPARSGSTRLRSSEPDRPMAP